MPTGSDPPPVRMSSTVFNALTGMDYNSTAKAFTDAQSNSVFLFVEKDANDKCQWFYGTNTHPENSNVVVPRLDDQLVALNVNIWW